METTTTKKNFIRLRAQGNSFDRIAKKLKISKATLIDWSKEFEEEISNLKALELEALYEELYLSIEHRLRTLGPILQNVENELKGRDFKEVQTDKLLDMYIKIIDVVKAEKIEPGFFSSAEISEEKAYKKFMEKFSVS